MQAVPPGFSLSLKQLVTGKWDLYQILNMEEKLECADLTHGIRGDSGKTASPYITASLREQQCSPQHWQHTEHPLLQQQCHLTQGHSQGAAQDCGDIGQQLLNVERIAYSYSISFAFLLCLQLQRENQTQTFPVNNFITEVRSTLQQL
ncbi:hypothetical protein EK904_003409 [Melospiza melodia maxima]|nr:hypothetical protein EK904_003409 [Melospiza melodia maxima]